MILRSIIRKSLYLLAVTGAVCVCGCGHSNDPCPPGDKPVLSDPTMVNLCLQVSFDGQGADTRAGNDPDGYEEPNGPFEKISTLRVIIIRNIEEKNEFGNPTGTIVKKEVEANRLVATNDAGYPKHDDLEFEVVADETKLIYLIANETSLKAPENLLAQDGKLTASAFLSNYYQVGSEPDLDQLKNWTVSVPNVSDSGIITNGLFSDSKALIPMLPLTEFFEIKVDSKTAVDDTCYSNLFMTRAAAKATFYLDPEGLGPYKEHDIRITSLSLTGVGSEEYVFPYDTEYSSGKYQDGKPNSNIGNTYITKFVTPKASKPLTYLLNFITEENPYGKSMDIAGNDPVAIAGPIYFPESILKPGEHYMVTVGLSTGVELTASLVTSTTPEVTANILNIDGKDAIARSTHLVITLSFAPQQLDAIATVLPYTAVSLNPEFGFAPPVRDKLVLPESINLQVGQIAELEATFDTEDSEIKPLIAVVTKTETEIFTLMGPDPEDSTKQIPVESTLVTVDSQKKFKITIKGINPGESTLMIYSQTGLTASCPVIVK